MKRLFIVLVSAAALFTNIAVQAQGSQRMMQRKDERRNTKGAASCPRVYIGFSTGINNPVGLIGPQVDVAVSPSVSVGTGVGLSTWGTKTFLEARYYFKPCNRGWAIGSGFTYNTGLDNVAFKDVETLAGDADVSIDGKPQANFMVSGYHFFNLGRARRNRFHLQFGFSVPLSNKEFTQVSGPPVTGQTRDVLLTLAPGGIIIGLGFSFGAGNM